MTKHTCDTQKNMLMEFISKHEKMNSGKFDSTFTYKTCQKLWQEITESLNSVPNGANKNWKQWRKYWQDQKKYAKQKNAQIKKYSCGTGGGGPISLGDYESKILELMSETQLSGMGVSESPAEFSLDVDVETQASTSNINGNEEIIVETLSNEQLSNVLQPIDNNIIIDDNREDILHSQELSQIEEVQNDLQSTSTRKTTYKSNKPKRINKTTRLQTSLQVTQDYLNDLKIKNSIIEKYYQTKSQYLNNKNRHLFEIRKKSNLWWKYLNHNS